MFNPSTIETNFSGLIGFRQHYNAGYDRIDSDVSTALSGLYIDSSAHSLLTIENISAIAENFSKTDVSAYSSTTSYGKGDIVKDATIVYESLAISNLNNAPASSPTKWRVTNLLSAYLRRVLKSASINLFNAVFSQKKLYEVAKTLLSDTSLYEGVGNLSRKIGKLSRFVGFRFIPKFPDTVISISWAGFQFDTVNPTFKLYVYHSSQNDPIKQIDINLATAISFSWKELAETISLPFGSNDKNTKGYYYVGYYEDDLAGQAIWKEQGFSGSSCASCNNLDTYLWKQWSKYFVVQPMYVENAWLYVDKKLFNEEKAIELNNQNWGLNFKIQVSCDVTDLICRNKFSFTDALKKQVVHDMLRDMAYSMRDNQKKEKVAQLAAYALENKENNTKGVIRELEDAIKNVSFDLSSINEVCLPCNDAGAGALMVTSVF